MKYVIPTAIFFAIGILWPTLFIITVLIFIIGFFDQKINKRRIGW